MIKKIKQLSFFGLLFLATSTLGQEGAQRKADTSYDRLAYIDAIKVYERITNKGFINTDVLTKLADAYYFNGKLVQANAWYTQLFEADYSDKDLEKLASEYYYRYAQTLKSVEDYEKSALVMEQFSKREQQDSRAVLFENNKNFLNEIENSYQRFELKALDINSSYSDYGAALLGNDLIFTSARQTSEVGSSKIHLWTNESYTSLYRSTILQDGSFSEPTLLSNSVDSKVNDATAVFTKDGKTMYFTRNNSNDNGRRKYNKAKSSLLKLYRATLNESGQWTDVVELPFNSNNFNTAHPALTPDDSYLYFSSDRKGTIGQSDIFRVAILPEGQYGEVENIGAAVNTEARETFPFISKDNYLFFASDGHPGLGGLDVFVSKINVDGTQEPVKNLGSPINSPYDDFSIYLDTDTRKGFVSSNREDGHGGDDIYVFYEKECQSFLEGIVYDVDQKTVLPNALVVISSSAYQPIDSLYTDSNGYYKSSALKCLGSYRVQGSKPDYSTVELLVHLSGEPQDKKVDLGLGKSTIELAPNDDLFKKLNLNPIYFDFDKSFIRPDAAIELSKIVEVMNLYPTMKIDVRSHTDSRGNDEYNMKLSERRVKSTIKWIIEQGIDKDRLQGRGYGESQLQNKCSNGVPCTVEEHQLNRRSEFIILEL